MPYKTLSKMSSKKLDEIKENSFDIIAPKIISSLSNKDLNPFMLKPLSFIYDIYYLLYYWYSVAQIIIEIIFLMV